MNVFVIPEDFRKDQYILKPIIKRMIEATGHRNAKVRVCQDPLLGGISQALNWENIEEIIEKYKGMVDLFILCVDRDGIRERRLSLNRLEESAAEILQDDKCFFAENAWQEVEVWVLAGHSLPADWNWHDIRNEISLKERYFEPFVNQQGLQHDPGGGRKRLAEEAAGHYRIIRNKCPEDIGALEERVRIRNRGE